MIHLETGNEVPQGNQAVQELEALLTSPSFEQAYVAVQTAIDPEARMTRGDLARLQEIKEGKAKELLSLRNEFAERKDDSEFLKALEVWGRSPNSRGERGQDGEGFHAGIVHYFEYRAVGRSKARRLNNSGPPSIQGFIDFSSYLQSLVDRPDPRSNTAIKTSAQVVDEQGQRRLLLLTQGDWLVVGFQRLGDRMRVISAGAEEKPERFEKRVREELEGFPDKDTRLNRLGHGRVLVQV